MGPIFIFILVGQNLRERKIWKYSVFCAYELGALAGSTVKGMDWNGWLRRRETRL